LRAFIGVPGLYPATYETMMIADGAPCTIDPWRSSSWMLFRKATHAGQGYDRPRLLILDEPVSALDVSVGAQIVRLLRQLQQEHGLTYLFISHSMPLVRYLSTRIAVMDHGRLVETGEAESLCNSPREAYTRQLLAATPELPAGVA
jgi:ABC-type glutathione transport system ATPase component